MQHYTLAQVRTFLMAIDRAERASLATQLALAITAMRGDSAGIKALQKELRGCE